MQPYLQTTPFTCAASALLTVLHNTKKTKLSKENEFKIWKATVNLPTRASSVYALASYAHEQGLNPKIVVENTKYDFPDYRFYRYTKQDIEQADFSAKLNLKRAKDKGIEITKSNTTLEDIKKELKNNMILLRINTKPIRNEKRNTSNYIVVYNYQNNHYQIVDPKLGTLSVPEKVMEEAFQTLETKKYRNHKMVLFSK
jgi:predicted double-glycine peptidase